MRLCISLATRGRPQQVTDTVERSLPNLVCENTKFVIQIDADDHETSIALCRSEAILRDGRVILNVRPREDTIAAKWNRALKVPADLYLVAADDDPYITPGYDLKLLAAAELFPDRIGMVYGHMANVSFSGVVAPTAKLVEKMGGIFPEYFPYWFSDHWTDDIARIIGRISFADVRTDQSRAGKTQELREVAWWATWFDAAYLVRRRIAHKIIDDSEFHEPLWRKKMLKTHHPLIEFRSRWINDHVRASASKLDIWSGLGLRDERYQRVRQRAVDMIPELLEDMDSTEAYRYKVALSSTIPTLRRTFADENLAAS